MHAKASARRRRTRERVLNLAAYWRELKTTVTRTVTSAFAIIAVLILVRFGTIFWILGAREMASTAVGTDERLRVVRPTLWALVGLMALVLVYLIAGRVERMIERWPQTGQSAVTPAHCAEFIELAKAAYGVQWRARLDPGNTTCANEIQQAWEQQRISVDAEAERALEMSQSAASVAAQPAPTQTVHTPQAPADTYCLNIISLARAKYGSDWASKIDPAERTACVRP